MANVRDADDEALPPQGTIGALLALLVCPVDKCELVLVREAFVCGTCGREYPIEDDIPNMLVAPEQV